MLHITDGESVAGTLRKSGIPGDVGVYGDLMYEGPCPSGLDEEAWREVRSQFRGPGPFGPNDEDAREFLKACFETLEAFPKYDEVVIWLDYKLSNQLMLIKMLDWFSRRDLGSTKLSLICIGSYPGLDRFLGLGHLTADQLASLADTRLPVGEEQLRTARAAWAAFTSPDPVEIERFMATDTSALPFLVAALRRHLEQFPSVENGLSRTERQALSVLRDRGTLGAPWLFVEVQRVEDPVFMGDLSFYSIIADLAGARLPLVQITDASSEGPSQVTITESGRQVLEGQADHVRLNGIDRWLGGVHLKGDKSLWRWDGASGKLAVD